jgi:hypothetical protein
MVATVLTIELSTVAFYRGEVPNELSLCDCMIPMVNQPSRAFSAFYGLQGKQDGFVAAQNFAATRGLKYTVIDMLVELEKQNPGLMKPQELAKFDFLNFSRSSRGMIETAAEWLVEIGALEAPSSRDLPREQSLRTSLMQRPSLVDDFLGLPQCSHLKVIAFQAQTSLSDRPISLANVPFHHWKAIREASCRLDPTVRITLEPPNHP